MVGAQLISTPGRARAATGSAMRCSAGSSKGMDVVRRILAAPTSPTEGEGVMRGQMLSPRIRILTARRAG